MRTMNKLPAILIWVFVIAILALVGRSFWQVYQPVSQKLQGQIEACQYNISSKVPGRVNQVMVDKGDSVAEGQLIFTLLSPELDAKLEQAKAGSEAASALADEAEEGEDQ
jgi:HlyD family secretion protein